MAKITINGVSFDPESQMPALAAAGMEEADSQRSNYILVQTTHALLPVERKALEAAQATPLEHVPGSAYICSYAPSNLEPVRQLPFVRWAHVYLDNFKIAPRLRGDADASARVASVPEAAPVHASMSQQPRTVDVVLHRDADARAVAVDLAKAVRLDPESLKVSGGKLRVTVQPQMLDRIVRIDAVRHLEEYVPPQLHNTVAVRLVGAERVHAHLEFEGDQQVIAVCDTGLDLGSQADVHPAFSGRVKRIYALGRPGTASDPHGHGTHVAGSVLGDGSSSSMGGPVRGAAPRARLVMQSVLDGNGRLGGLPDDLRRLFRDPYVEDGARIHTNSWGAPNFGQYTDESHAVDDFVWQHRDMLILFSAGNDGCDRNANGVIHRRVGELAP